MKRITYYKRFPTAKKAMIVAIKHGGSITNARGFGKLKTGFVAYTTGRKVKGWKSSKVEY
jgi:hypothetical protein